MSYPLIIFGAGASYDYSQEGNGKKISPLTRDLVEMDFSDADLLDKYEGVGDLLGEIATSVRKGEKSFEGALREIEERDKSEATQKQFIAMEFYLQSLFGQISDPTRPRIGIHEEERRRMHRMNNYRTLLNRINNNSNGRACVVSFNYDTLFEDSLPENIRPTRIHDYISKDIKIIKPHGSHDWIYINRISHRDFSQFGAENEFEWCCKELTFLPKMKKEAPPYHKREVEERKSRSKELVSQYPAIAIPLEGKDNHICPKEHIDEFKKTLPDVDRVLIIGWRAADPLVLDILAESLPEMGYKVLIVSETKDGAEEIAGRVKEKLKIVDDNYIEAYGGGFSGFVSTEKALSFFTD